MPSSRKAASWRWFLFFAFLFTLQTVPRIFTESPINDEPGELTTGYFYWEGNVTSHNRHPPIPKMLQSLPLRFLGLKEPLPAQPQSPQGQSYDFFFIYNKDRFELMTILGRFVSLLFGLGLGFLLFLQTRRHSPAVWMSALVLWVFEPTLLAYSGLCLADLPTAFFFLAAVLAFQRHLQKPGWVGGFLAGALAATAVLSKFSALALIPLFGFLEISGFLNRKVEKRKKPPSLGISRDWLGGGIGFLLVVFLIYLPGTFHEADHRGPWVYFWRGLMDMIHYSDYHHPTYFLGQASRQNHWLCFPLAFVLKTPIPFLLLILAALVSLFRKKLVLPAWLWFSPLFFFVCILPVQNLGVRYLLPSIPFFILMASFFADHLWKWGLREGRNLGKILLVGLLLWNGVSVLSSFPKIIGYFNDLIPEEKKVYFLGDADLDMGQDVKELAQTAIKKGWKNVKLAQFGGATEPSFYGLDWNPWTQKDLSGPQPGFVYAVNMAFFQLGPVFLPELTPIAQSWVSSRPPSGRIGSSWIYFKIPGEIRPDSSPALPSVKIF